MPLRHRDAKLSKRCVSLRALLTRGLTNAWVRLDYLKDKEHVPLLCVTEPHLAKGEILVTPCVIESIRLRDLGADTVTVHQSSCPHTGQQLASTSSRMLLLPY